MSEDQLVDNDQTSQGSCDQTSLEGSVEEEERCIEVGLKPQGDVIPKPERWANPRRFPRKKRSAGCRSRTGVVQRSLCAATESLAGSPVVGTEDAFSRDEYHPSHLASARYKTINDLVEAGLLAGIPQREMSDLSFADREKIRLANHVDTPLTHALLVDGYDLRLGEKGRGDLKQEISKRTCISGMWRDKCASIARLKHAQIIQLVQFAEICCCIQEALHISDAYWNDVSRKVYSRSNRGSPLIAPALLPSKRRCSQRAHLEFDEGIRAATRADPFRKETKLETMADPGRDCNNTALKSRQVHGCVGVPRFERVRPHRSKRRKEETLNFSSRSNRLTNLGHHRGGMVEPRMFADPTLDEPTSSCQELPVHPYGFLSGQMVAVDQWLLDVTVSIADTLQHLALPSCSEIVMETLSIMNSDPPSGPQLTDVRSTQLFAGELSQKAA